MPIIVIFGVDNQNFITMIIDKPYIRKNSLLLYSKMKTMCSYTFDELQKLVNLGSTELCLALMELLQENKISQHRDKQGISYMAI